jgi:Tol biopolymer transport system component
MQSRSTLIAGIILAVGLLGIVMIAYATIPNPIPLPTVVFPSISLPSFIQAPTGTPPTTLTPVHPPSPTPTSTPTPTPIPVSEPLISPDGKLAYAEAGRLVVTGPDGSTVTVAQEGVKSDGPPLFWSPDGGRLLYATAGQNESEAEAYHVWDAATGQVLHLNQELPHLASEIQGVPEAPWSPDGRYLLFFSSTTERPEDSLLLLSYWVVDVETRRFWCTVEERASLRASWVNTSTILYTEYQDAGARTLHLVAADPATTTPTGTLDVHLSGNEHYALSPDRRHLAGIERPDESSGQMWLAPLPGHPLLALPVQPADTVPLERAPLWSPDGRWIAYGALRPISGDADQPGAGERTDTVLVDTTGISPTRIIGDLLPQAWSPDGRLLAGPICQGAGCGLTVADVRSGRTTTITSSAQGQLVALAWSPQGVYLAYSQAGPDADANGLALWDRATGTRRLLVPGDGTNSFTDLQWTPDGCYLYFAERGRQVEGERPVEAIWGLGPHWEHHWQVAPLDPANPASLADGPLPCPPSLLAGRRLISFYGTSLGPGLGILGRYDITTTLDLLSEQIQAYHELDALAETEVEIIPGFHMVTTIADGFPGGDGDYNHRVSHDAIRPWIDGVRAAEGWAVLDIQPAHADLDTELALIEPLIQETDVHLAIDPEFVMRDATQIPGSHLGQMTGPQINRAQAWLDQIARATGQRKMLIIHQFEDQMVDQKEDILHYPLVDLVWDADGFGGPGSKIADYGQYRDETGFEYGGFKVFYRYDTPVMTPEQVLSLEPPAAVVIYQ